MLPAPDDLFERWRRRGDSRALAQVFDRTAPEVWRVARHLAGTAHEADDLVQATFLAAIEGAARWRRELPLVPWLLGILVNKLRQQRRRSRRERALAVPAAAAVDADPLDQAAHAEFRSLLRARLADLPEIYRSVLVLQLEHGLTAAEVASALGRPRATVRSQLHRGLELLRLSLPASIAAAPTGGERIRDLRAVRGAVLAAAGVRGGAISTSVGVTIVMKKLLTVGAVLLAAGLWLAWPRHERAPDAVPPPATAAETAAGRPTSDSPAAAPGARTEVEVAPLPVVASALVVRVSWSDATPAAGTWVCVEPAAASNWFAQRWLETDGGGVARFAPLSPGEYRVRSRHGASVNARIVDGVEGDVDLRLPRGVDLRGTVVDQEGRLVARAVIVVGPGTESSLEVARSDANGAFFVRSVAPASLVAAFAAGHAASQTEAARAFAEGPVELRLGAVAGVVRGRILDAEGRPLPGAWVAHGYADIGGASIPRGPAVMRTVLTDDLGEFTLQAVPLGMPWPLHVGAHEHAVWRGETRVLAGETPFVEVRLQRGVSLRGTLRDAEGAPVSGFVNVVDCNSPGQGIADQRPSWARGFRGTATDGTFAFTNLPAGELSVSAHERRNRVATRTFTAQPGDALVWDPILRGDLAIIGRVVDAAGGALAGCRVVGRGGEGVPSPAGDSTTDAEGTFRLGGCAAAPYSVRAYAPGDRWHQPIAVARDVHPGVEPLLLRVERAAFPSCEAVGRLAADQEGGVMVVMVGARGGLQTSGELQPDQEFTLGPVPPGEYSLQIQRTVGAGFGEQIVAALGSRTLTAGERCELGSVGMPPLGELAVELVDAAGNPVPQASLNFALLDAPMGGVAVRVRDGRGSAQAAPGTYLPAWAANGLCVEHPPITVTAGERTSVRVTAAAGVHRKLRYDTAALGVPLRVIATWHKGGRALRRQWFDFWREVPSEHDEQLTPGEWELELVLGTGTVQRVPILVTGDADAPVVEIVLER